jgi:bifunctional non-homologous end joining protein LigD
MEAMLVDSIRPGDWLYEIKFDGYRAVALRSGNETRVLSRNEKDLGGKFPEAALPTWDSSPRHKPGRIIRSTNPS